MEVKKFTFSPFGVNTYVVYDSTKEAVVIDPACYSNEENEMLKFFIDSNGLKIKYVLLTHGHLDHCFGLSFITKSYNVDVAVCSEDIFLLESFVNHAAMYGLSVQKLDIPKLRISNNDCFSFGKSELRAIHVPGHSPGSMVFYNELNKILFVGDVLFLGSIGRTDLPGGDHHALINGIKNNIFTLNTDSKVYCGHGYETTIKDEMRSNPFLT